MGNFFGNLFKKKETPPKEEVEEAKPTGPHAEVTASDFATQILSAHNQYRMKHGAGEMKLDQSMCAEAQAYAEELLKANALNHADTNDGENLAQSSGKLTGQATADMWYNEIKDYNFDNPGYSSKTGHFSQIVWKGSEKFGVGVAFGEDSTFVVGRYRPAGNINTTEQFKDNVLAINK